MVDSTKMLEMIRLSPGIRTMQLCDQLDEEIDDIEIALQRELRHSVIQSHDVIAPNKRRATGFTIAGVPLPVDTVPAARLPEASIPKVEKREPMPKPLTKVAKAIAFIKEHPDGIATGAQLSVLLALKPTEVPSNYLASALKNYRLVKEGKNWRIGTGIPPAKDVVAEKLPVVAFPAVPDAAKTASVPENVQVDSVPSLSPPPAPAQSCVDVPSFLRPLIPAITVPSDPERFQCAVWSSGELQLVRGERVVIKLSAEETRTVREYLSRVKGPLVAA
jgi:hypothetical protein